jgi:type IX secretion system PorP/SprF family membrane protein
MRGWAATYSLVLIIMTKIALAQDIHFSQFYASPVLLNPAAAGAGSHDLRLTVNYRDQWQNVISPFKTIGCAFDAKLRHLSKNGFNYFSYGITMYTDKAGASRSTTNQFNGLLAYHLYVDRVDIISFGVNAGMFQKSINTSNLKWDAQFNGKNYDASLPTQENSNYQSLVKFDLGAGLLYEHRESAEKTSYQVGLSVNHITKPNISYYSSDPSLQFKYTVTGNASVKLDHGVYLVPAVLIAKQGGHAELLAGSNVRFVSSDHGVDKNSLSVHKARSTALQVGTFYRYKDAVVCVASVEYDHQITVGLSYDINVSKLSTVSKWRGGYEVCITYTDRKKRSKTHSKL